MKTYAVISTENGDVLGHISCGDNDFVTMVMPEGQALVDDVAKVVISIERQRAARARDLVMPPAFE